jgi:hypothetical protein
MAFDEIRISAMIEAAKQGQMLQSPEARERHSKACRSAEEGMDFIKKRSTPLRT